MEMTFTNKAMQAMTGFAIQLNKNSFGLSPGHALSVQTPLHPNVSSDVSLLLNTMGPVQKMNPLSNLQVAIKNNVDVFYFSCIVPLHVFCCEDGAMEKRVFLATWKDIPTQNEVQYAIENVTLTPENISQKLQANNIFTTAKRNVEGQDMLYQSIKLINGIWILAEIKIQPGNPKLTLSLKSRASDVSACVHQMYEALLHN
jgi:AP-1 complex subunit beta-1